MKLLRKLFPVSFSSERRVSNSVLAEAIKAWNRSDSPGNFDKVINILTSNDAMLFLPSTPSEAKQVRKGNSLSAVLDLTAIWEQDGIRTLAVFTSEEVMFEHTGKRNYVCLGSRYVLDSCLHNNVKKVIVFGERFEMFVLEWQES